MATLAKTVVATGGTSGLGFEVIKQLMAQAQPYNFVLGARNTEAAKKDFGALKDDSRHKLTVLPLELSDLKGVKKFARQALDAVGGDKIDYLMLNAAFSQGSEKPGPHGSKWCESYIVNHLSQHYLVHLLREKLVASGSRIVVVSSGAVRGVQDPAILDTHLKGGAGEGAMTIYADTKFVQLLGAHWWRRELARKCAVVAVSPGLIPGTGLSRGWQAQGVSPPHIDLKDAKSVAEGGENILRAFTRDDFPEDPEQIFLTSWGEWWSKDVYEKSLDKALWEKWSPSLEQIEAEEGITA